jgi:hypothetical protein
MGGSDGSSGSGSRGGPTGRGGRGGPGGRPGGRGGPEDRHDTGGRDAPTPPPRVTFVRLEKPSYLGDIAQTRQSDEHHALPNHYLIESGASQKRKRELDRAKFLERETKPGAGGARDRAKGFADSLALIQKPPSASQDAKKVSALRAKHATSSATSPFISATPTFTTGDEGQLHYMKGHLADGQKSFVTVHESMRRITPNETNSREKELLVPFGERRSELRGFLQITPVMRPASAASPAIGESPVAAVHALFIDLSVTPPRVYTGKNAIRQFQSMTPTAAEAFAPALAAAAPHASAATPSGGSRLESPRQVLKPRGGTLEKPSSARPTAPKSSASSFAPMDGPRSAAAGKPSAYRPGGGGGPKDDVRERSSASKPASSTTTRSASTSRTLPSLSMPGAPEASASPVGGSLLSKPSPGYASRNFSSASSSSPSKASGSPKAAAPRPKPPEAHPPAKPGGPGGK